MAQDQPNLSEHTVEALLILATLIASVTFQAGLNPPGGLWQDNPPQPQDLAPSPSPPPPPPPPADTTAPFTNHIPGQSILANNRVSYGFYIVCNTAAFSASSSMIGSLIEVSGDFKVLVRVALFFMGATYVASVLAVRPDHGATNTWIFFFTFFLALLVPFLVLFARDIWKKITAAWAER